MEIRCCVCGKVRRGNTWVVAADAKHDALISHGYCPPCAKAATDELRGHRHALAASEACR